MTTSKPVEITKFPLHISLRLSKNALAKSKFDNKENNKSTPKTKVFSICSYVQVLAPSISKVLKIKKSFPSLLSRKIEDIYRIIHGSDKPKLKINMIVIIIVCGANMNLGVP